MELSGTAPFRLSYLAPRFWHIWLGLGLFALVGQLPRGARHALGGYLGARFYGRRPKRRQITLDNLARCFPERDDVERERMADCYFRLFGIVLIDYSLLWWGSERRLRRLIRVEGEEHILRSRASGRGVILCTGHSIALDFGVTAISMRHPGAGPMKPARNPLINWFVIRGRTRFLGRVFARDAGIRAVVRQARQGNLVYYLPDEDLGSTQKTVLAPFFGVPKGTLTALGRLARACNAEVLPCMSYLEPESGTYVTRIDPPLEGFPSGDEQADAVWMNAELERLIRRAPDQYFWSMRIFQTAVPPEGGGENE